MAHKNVDYKPEDIQFPNQKIVQSELVHEMQSSYIEYAMSVIVSRAIPEIDGFKPSHRKLLYTMYEMGLLTKPRTKSANIVGQTMKLNPHGDQAIYETMVRLARGNETLLHPFIDSKGNFGKVYSRDMAYAASRYTEAKLEPICAELFRDIDADTVDFVDNYDGSMQEPVLLPTTFPNVLVSANMGIAVGMASNICSFNLAEVCRTAIALIKNPDADLLDTLLAPDFPTGGEILYDPAQMLQIYETGRGSFRLRAKWRYVKEGNMIEIYEIPYTTATEIILDKVAELIKANKGVVLCHGGFGADIAYRQVQDPKLTDKFDTTNHRGATGELWKEAARNGVLMIQADRVQVVPWCSPYEKSMGNMWQFSQTCAAPYGIWVDVNTGKRFINELGNRKVRSDAIIALNNIGHKCISLTDVRGAKQLEKNRPGTLPKLMATKGLLELPTLEAVAKYYGTPYDVLKGEVDQYNANVRNKIEVDSLGKTYNADCTEMKTGPWYAAELMPKIHHCMGGIVTNPQGQALDAGL